MVDAALSELHRVDILINNAGIFPRATLLEMDEATGLRHRCQLEGNLALHPGSRPCDGGAG